MKRIFGVVQSYQFHNHKFYIPVEFIGDTWKPLGHACNDRSEAWEAVAQHEESGT